MDALIKETHQQRISKQKLKPKQLEDYLWLLLFTFIPLVILGLFWIYPLFSAIYLSFTNWDYISPTYQFIGLENYLTLFQDPEFYRTISTTFKFTIVNVSVTIFVGLFLASLLIEKNKLNGFYQTLIFSPWVTPMVAVSIVWSWIFDPKVGFMNYLLSLFGIGPLGWGSSETYALPMIMIVTIWKGVGWAMIFYLNAINRIPKELYEAASIDGASNRKTFWKITLPLVSPTTLFLSVVLTVDTLQAYDQIQIMTQGGPAGSTRTILYLYYQTAFEQFDIGRATAIAIVIFLICAIISLIQFVISKRWTYY